MKSIEVCPPCGPWYVTRGRKCPVAAYIFCCSIISRNSFPACLSSRLQPALRASDLILRPLSSPNPSLRSSPRMGSVRCGASSMIFVAHRVICCTVVRYLSASLAPLFVLGGKYSDINRRSECQVARRMAPPTSPFVVTWSINFAAGCLGVSFFAQQYHNPAGSVRSGGPR